MSHPEVVTIPENIAPVLARLASASRRYFGIDHVSLQPVAVFARPFSEVLQVRLVGHEHLPHAFVKRFKLREPAHLWQDVLQRRVEREFDTCLRTHEALSGASGLSAVRPIACFPEDLVIVTEQVRGQPLSAILEERASWYPAAVTVDGLSHVLERVGGWVRTFQSVMPRSGRVSLDDLREYLDHRLKAIVQARGAAFSESDRALVLRHFDALASAVRDHELRDAAIHADFCPANVLVQQCDVAVIDFDRAGTGCAYLDIARMFTQLDFLQAKPRFRPGVVRQLQAALLRGYDPDLDADHPLFRLMVLQHTVCQFKKLAQRRVSDARLAWLWYLRRRHRNWLRTLSLSA